MRLRMIAVFLCFVAMITVLLRMLKYAAQEVQEHTRVLMNLAYATAVASTLFLSLVMILTETSVHAADIDPEHENELLDMWMILLNLSLLIWNISLGVQTLFFDFIYHKILFVVHEKRKIEEELYGIDFEAVSYNDEDTNLKSLRYVLAFYGIIAVYQSIYMGVRYFMCCAKYSNGFSGQETLR